MRRCVFGDGRWLYLSRPGDTSAQIVRFDLRERKREIWKDIRPRDPEGMLSIQPADVTPDGGHYIYSCFGFRSMLFLVEGVR